MALLRKSARFHDHGALFALIVLIWAGSTLAAESSAEALDTLRRVGRAYYENDEFQAAAAQFRQAVAQAPRSAPDAFNLGLVLMRAADHTNALTALDQAERLDPKLLAVPYVRGIIFKRLEKFPLAIQNLRQVVAGDPTCVGALYNLAMCYKASGRYTNAIETLHTALKREPNNPNCHYQLITLHRRLGQVEEAARHAEAYDRVKDTLDESEKTVEALERSRYSYIIEVPPASQDLGAALDPQVHFADVTKAAGLTPPQPPPPLPSPPPRQFRAGQYDASETPRRYVAWVGGSVALGDYDGDGKLDIYVVTGQAVEGAGGSRLYHNDGGGRFTDVTAKAGVGNGGLGTHAVFGDYDNDGHLDLYVARYGPNILYRNRGDGAFEDVSQKARVNEPQFARRAAFADYDHDHDLDLLVANGVDLSSPPAAASFTLPDDFPGGINALLRNNGDGTFSDQTDEAGLLIGAAQARDLICADFDDDHDLDLFVANADSPPQIFLNARLGKFVQGGSFHPPLAKGVGAAVEADLNRDRHPDLIIAVETNLYLYTNDGRSHFKLFTNLSGVFGLPPSAPIARVKTCDLNNDSWPDLLLTDGQGKGLRWLAGAGKCQFQDLTAAGRLDQVAGIIADFAAGDLDGDGDQDLVIQTRDRGPVVLRNEGGNARHWLAVRLLGKKVNRRGYGATVEVAARGLYQRQTVWADTVHFGLGRLTNVEVVRVTWPNGMAQNLIQPAADRALDFEEYVKVSASCAFLWADGGQGFKLINEILGVGPLGVPMSPDWFFPFDCTELTKIEPDQLAAKDGFYELRLTEDLREIAFVDEVRLRVVDHPADLEVIPNEMFTGPPFPADRFFAVREHRVPLAATDDRGCDVLDLIRARDGRFPTFARTAHDGLAQPHSLTLDLGDLSSAKQVLLFLDGWIYWPDSSVSWGLFQNPNFEIAPLRLEVCDAQGRWQTAIASVGLPTSKGLVVPVDLTGKFLCQDWRVRLSTTLCVYFDRVFVSTGDEAARCRLASLPAASANLHFRGFAKMTRDELGFERFDYDAVSPTGPWNPPRGLLTLYGDVTPLLSKPDDMYAVLAPGDEMTMRFDARSLPALPTGWKRSFVFYANGWVKDGDLNTQCSETVEPLPFHGMSAYPYPPSESYPNDPAHRQYLRAYQTRPSQPTVGDLTKFRD